MVLGHPGRGAKLMFRAFVPTKQWVGRSRGDQSGRRDWYLQCLSAMDFRSVPDTICTPHIDTNDDWTHGRTGTGQTPLPREAHPQAGGS